MKTLKASTGMWYTNGETFGKTVSLPSDADTSVWYQITDNEKNEMEIAQSSNMEEN